MKLFSVMVPGDGIDSFNDLLGIFSSTEKAEAAISEGGYGSWGLKPVEVVIDEVITQW